MNRLLPYLGNLHEALPEAWADVALVLCSVLCGMIVGLEREVKDKPAGLKTVALISIGSTVFTLASLLMSHAGRSGDPARLAAQVVVGVGFLGAGAIMRDRGTIVGLTTGATIWTVAAIGVLIGAGYAVAGIGLSLLVVLMLTGVRLVEKRLSPCRKTTVRIGYQPDHGKTFLQILEILDQHGIPDRAWRCWQEGQIEVMEIEYCHFHRPHRAFLPELGKLPEVVSIQGERAARCEER